jgi:predicted Zn-ribbon and HTH transcriptional regulator
LSEPKPKSQTARQALLEALRAGPRTARELSAEVSLPEREVLAHLEHLERSLARGELELRVEPPRCQECGFGFKKRERLGRPSRCPRCRSERLDSPLFSVKPR